MTPSERQKKYTTKLRSEGKCVRCREKALKGKCLCKDCTVTAREYMRMRTNSKPWVKGSRGRPPLY